jgi:transcriptional regulator with GAF, ATPase, and Fis domain
LSDSVRNMPDMEEMKVFLEVSGLISTSLNQADHNFQPLFSLLKRVIPYESATIFTYNISQNRLECIDSVGENHVNLIDIIEFDMGFGLSAWIAQNRKPVILSSLHRKKNKKSAQLRSFIGLPLIVDDKLLGVINFGHSTPKAFKDIKEEPLVLLSSQIALVLQNLKLVTSLAKTNRKLMDRNDQLRDMQNQVIESEKVKAISEIVIAMNHEINNPLTIISGNAELLALKLENQSEETFSRLNAIIQQVRRLGRVMNMMANIQRPAVENYAGGERMLDIESSSRVEIH